MPLKENNNHRFKIPDDLLRFLKNETYSLLIKGEPGKGKTALCLTILRVLNIKNNFFYISTRLSPNKLFYYFKWINKYLKIKQSNLHGKSSKTENLFAPYFEDARLDEPESLFERITNQLMDVRAPLIIVDSWDGIASFMDRESRLNNERVLQTWLERAGGRLILVEEGTEISTLDYLVDGIVTLRNKNYEGHEIREIYLNKLRGINLTKKSFLFTLQDGIFRTIESYHEYLSSSDSVFRSSMVPSNKFGSGYDVLNNDLNGGFSDNSIILIEYDFKIGLRGVMMFLLKFINESIQKSSKLFVEDSLINSYYTILHESNKDNLDIFTSISYFFKKSPLNSFEKNLENITLSNSLNDELDKLEPHLPKFGIVDLDNYGQEINYPKISNLLKNQMNISFLIKKLEIPSKYSYVSDYHLQLSSIDGIFFITCKYPISNIYVLEFQKNKIEGKLVYKSNLDRIF